MYLADTVEQRQFSQLVAANLQAIGIKVVPKPVTWAQVTQSASSIETTANLTVISDSLKYPPCGQPHIRHPPLFNSRKLPVHALGCNSRH